MKPGEPVLLIGNGKRYFVKAGEEDLHTDVGVIKLAGLLQMGFGDILTSHLGFEFKLRRPRMPDFYKHLRRTGAPISPKDMGMIVAHTGLNKEDSVLDAGTGSGIMAIYLGCIANRVVTYEVREDFLEVARKNIALVGLNNIELRQGNVIYEIQSIDETFDVVTLDMHQSSEVIPLATKILKPGGFIVMFTPFFEQAKEVRTALRATGFEDAVTFECTHREISFSDRGTRPSTTRVGHTGFITFARMP